MSQWKYTRERLAKNEFCGAIINERAVFCICGQKVLLDKDYNESRLIEHSKNSRCKLNNKKRQLGLPGLFPILPKPKKAKDTSELSTPPPISPLSDIPDKLCPGLVSEEIRLYINRTPASYGGARRREFIGKDLFPDKFSSKSHFNSKKLNEDEMIQLNQQIIAKSEWVIDRFGICVRSINCEKKTLYGQACSPCSLIHDNSNFRNRVRATIPDPKNVKHIPKFYYNNNPLLTYLKNSNLKQLNSFLGNENSSTIGFWLELADKATQGAFEQKPVFKGLCYIMLQAAERKEKDKGLQNLKYSDELIDFFTVLGSISLKALELFCQNLAGMTIRTIRRHRSTSEDIINNPDFCYENVARFKRLLDALHYKGPVVAMTDCTKLKAGLQYSSNLGCIVGSTLDRSDCMIETYDDIYDKVSNIKQKNAIAKDVRVYVLQVPLSKFPPVIVAIIPTRGDNAEKIFAYHQKLLDIAARLEIHIISIGSDGAAAEFQAQNLLQATKTSSRIQHQNLQYGINFNCPIFHKVGPVIRIQNPKYRKKTARNAVMSDDSIMFKRDVIGLDRQDDNAAYRVFCLKNLEQILDEEKNLPFEQRGLFVYLFIMGELLDSYLNQNITHNERIEMAMTAYFFLHLWKYHIETLNNLYPSYVSISKNFLATQTFNIMISLVESLVLLIKIHRDYYKDIPLLLWKHGIESCEHIFGISHQFRSDFNYLEIIQIVPKIDQYLRSVKSDNLIFRKEKKVREGYDFNEYDEIDLLGDNLECLRYWPSDTEIDNAIGIGYKKAIHLARYLGMTVIPSDAHYFTIHKRLLTLQLENSWDSNDDSNDDNEFNDDSLSISQSISYAASNINSHQEEFNLDLKIIEKNYKSCQVIIEQIQKLPDVLWYANYSDEYNYTLDNGSLNVEYFLNLRQQHSYSNRKLERKRVLENNDENCILNELNINKASSLVSYLLKNDFQSVKSRKNQWKLNKETNCKISTKQVSLKYLSCANVTTLFPLQVGSYVIAIFDNTLCIAQIISMYEQKSSMHSYINTPISDLKSLSFISIKVFFHVSGVIFSS
ncbi:unnamed protein product [Rhizophagus irregularis]|nr:unnamed protein product [Rhizophagus irregularis]